MCQLFENEPENQFLLFAKLSPRTGPYIVDYYGMCFVAGPEENNLKKREKRLLA